MQEKTQVDPAYWLQNADDEERYSLIVGGKEAAIVDFRHHTLTLDPDVAEKQAVGIPYSLDLFGAAESRLGLPRVNHFEYRHDGVPPMRDFSLDSASLYRSFNPKSAEPADCIRLAYDRLSRQPEDLSAPAREALIYLGSAHAELSSGGTWTKATRTALQAAVLALGRLPKDALSNELASRYDCDRAVATLHENDQGFARAVTKAAGREAGRNLEKTHDRDEGLER